MEREDQTMRLVLVVVSGEVQEESPLRAIGSGEVDLVALSSAAFLELRVESFAAALAGSSVCLAKEEAKAKHAKSEKSKRACHDSFTLTKSVYRENRGKHGPRRLRNSQCTERTSLENNGYALSTNAARIQQLEMAYVTKNMEKLPS